MVKNYPGLLLVIFSSLTLRTYNSLMSQRGQADVAADRLLCFSQVIGELEDACVM